MTIAVTFPTVADDCIQQIPVHDNGEPLVALIAEAGAPMLLDESPQNVAHLGYVPDFRLRSSAAQRIAAVAAALPPGTRLLVKEAYRPLAIQHRYFDRYLAKLRGLHPDMDATALRLLAARFIAPPDCATHVTGGAVDVTLADAAGRELDMGTAYDASPEVSQNRCFTGAEDIPAAARALRQCLVGAMQAQGFVNYPYEWWHWSFGDKYWAHGMGEAAAIYGRCEA
ncbi:MAG TPA: M15 family metallopeptidase [Ideonella sp.]|uniref:M15 family metallopeptidase n=1 Tax=Ideonella sp. TaxID=1929293 RepID=UPI002B6B7883|nr:M15 family metallopeptidase [Ideonella sp.]HSI52143.1 M15 family metallopeptidase [Ideonella sp.]